MARQTVSTVYSVTLSYLGIPHIVTSQHNDASLTTLLRDTTDSGFGASDAWLITYRTLTLQYTCNLSKLIFEAEDVHSHRGFAALAQPPWLPSLAVNTQGCDSINAKRFNPSSFQTRKATLNQCRQPAEPVGHHMILFTARKILCRSVLRSRFSGPNSDIKVEIRSKKLIPVLEYSYTTAPFLGSLWFRSQVASKTAGRRMKEYQDYAG